MPLWSCHNGYSVCRGLRISVGSPCTHKTTEYKDPVKIGNENIWTDQSHRKGFLEEEVDWGRLEAGLVPQGPPALGGML